MGATLRIENLVVAFGGLRALDDVSTAFDAGEITGLIGPNGSGKSTLVNTLSGQITPQGGRIWFGTTDVTGVRADRLVRRGPRPHLPDSQSAAAIDAGGGDQRAADLWPRPAHT